MNTEKIKNFLEILHTPQTHKKRVIFVRHGYSEGNAKPEFYGATDYPLVPSGIRQAQLLGEHIQSYIHLASEIRTSNLARSTQTCKFCIDLDRDDIIPHMSTLKIKPSNNNWALQQDFEIFERNGKYVKSPDFVFVESVEMDREKARREYELQQSEAQPKNGLSNGSNHFPNKGKRGEFNPNGIKFTIDQRIQEFGLGIMENMDYHPEIKTEDLRRLYKCLYNGTLSPLGADTSEGFKTRIFESVNDLSDGICFVFCHSGILRTIYELFKPKDSYVHNCGMIMIDFDDLKQGASLRGLFAGFSIKK